MQAHLRDAGVETLVHYPVPIPRQPAFTPGQPSECPVADRICAEVLSLPLYPGLAGEAVREIACAVRRFAPVPARGSMR
jgi:dTDP-4-amino-4,6-dideoxygalactose transaminase